MRTNKFKHHNLSCDEMIMVVPDSLRGDERILEIMKELCYEKIMVYLTLNHDLFSDIRLEFHAPNLAFVNKDTDQLKVFSIIISQNMPQYKRDYIKDVLSGYFDENVKFDLYIEENYNQTFIIQDFVS